jgi:hypothetical protein
MLAIEYHVQLLALPFHSGSMESPKCSNDTVIRVHQGVESAYCGAKMTR